MTAAKVFQPETMTASEFRMAYRPRKRTKDDLEVRQRFNEVDADRSGSIDRLELTEALQAMNRYDNEAQVDSLMQAMDTDGDGKVQMRELIQYLTATANLSRPSEDEFASHALFASLAEGETGTGAAVPVAAISALLQEQFDLAPGTFEALYNGEKKALDLEAFDRSLLSRSS